METVRISEIEGKVPVEIIRNTNADGNDQLIFTFSDGTRFAFSHWQDCCECVDIEDVAGDWSNLLHHPLVLAEERTEEEGDCETWTFYTFRSVGGSVDVRWYGVSNGYYSERVSYGFIDPAPSA